MATQNINSSQKEINEIWKLFRETDRRMKDTDRRIKETDQEVKAMFKETDRRLKKLDELFNGHWGKLMEALVRGDLIKLLKERNIFVDYILHSEQRQGSYEERQWEVDIIAVNGKEAVVVEVKTTMRKNDVDHFIKKLEIFKKLRPDYKSKTIYGAVAYLKANEGSDRYAEKKKLFVIRAVGSSASITNATDFKPQSF